MLLLGEPHDGIIVKNCDANGGMMVQCVPGRVIVDEGGETEMKRTILEQNTIEFVLQP